MEAPPSLRVELHPSRLAAAFIALTHLATAALAAWLPGSAVLRAGVVLAIGAHALWLVRRSALRSLRSSIVAAELGIDRRAALIRRDGSRIDGLVLPQSYVGELVTTLLVRRDGHGHWRSAALWLLPDMLPGEELRRFRVLLRLGRPERA